jgi:PAS domain S-box-containing protein
VTDVADSRKIEQALQESEWRLQEIINNAPVILFALDRQGVFTFLEGRGLAAGERPAAAIGSSVEELYRDSPDMLGLLKRALAGEVFNSVVDHAGRAYDCHVRPVLEASGEVAGVIGVATDVTDRRRAEQALQQSEERLRQVIRSAPVLLFATDRNGVYTVSEGKTVQAFGARPGDAVGKSAFERYRDIPAITDSIRRALAGEEFTAVADIRGRTYECLCAPSLGAQGEVIGMIGVATDVTERRQAERQSRRLLDELAHTGRISTLAEMASGLAHELNQPLAAIVAYVDACQELVESGKMDGPQLSTVLQSVANQAERAGQIIHRLRKMIRRSQPVRAGIIVNDAVREVLELLEAEARQAGVTIDLALTNDLPEVEADYLQVQHVVLNLVRNGLEAMTEIPADRRRLSLTSGRTAAGGVEVSVGDLGHGLTAAAPDQFFDPFFTTKPKGLGLGLSISRTIVEAHGGKIWITANEAGGVTARFTLPRGSGKGGP